MPVKSAPLYDEDFFVWTQRQAEELRRAARAGSNLPLDWENIAEEIESLGNRDRREVESLTRLIIVHLLKLACSPAGNPRRGWRGEVLEYRLQLAKVLKNSPSLRAAMNEIVDEAWPDAVKLVTADLQDYGEYDRARPVLDLWRSRCLAADQILAHDLYSVPGSNQLVNLE